MCGRFVSASLPGEIADYFSAASVAKTRTEANYNVAPSVNVPVIVRSDDLRQLDLMRWGAYPVLGEVGLDWQQDDQCPLRDRD